MFSWTPARTAAVILALALLVPAVAEAQRGHPVRYAHRPLTLPDATLRFDMPLIWTIDDRDPDPGDDDALYFMGAIAAGVTRDFELAMQIVPLRFWEDDNCRFRGYGCDAVYAPFSHWLPHYGQAALSLTWRFVRSTVAEIGLRGDFILPIHDFGSQIGLPIVIHAGDVLRLETGPFFLIYFSDPTQTRFLLPVELAFSVSRTIYLGPEIGIAVYDGDYVEVPLGFFFGITVAGGRRPVVDLRAKVRSVDIANGFDVWQIGFGVTIYAHI
jgi:hypothetical protein